jgi:hypothetical protein
MLSFLSFFLSFLDDTIPYRSHSLTHSLTASLVEMRVLAVGEGEGEGEGGGEGEGVV